MDEVKVVSLDLDGTLVDISFTDMFWNHAIPKLFAEINGIPFDLAKSFVLKEYEKIGMEDMRWYIPEYWIGHFKLPFTIEEISRTVGSPKLYPEVEIILRDLSNGYKLVVASSNPLSFIEHKVETIRNYFAGLFSSVSQFGIARKTKLFYEEMCKSLAVRPQEVVHVGDDIVYDFEVPASVGIRAYFLDRVGHAEGPLTISDLLQLKAMLQEAK